jgi:hypothetical protein
MKFTPPPLPRKASKLLIFVAVLVLSCSEFSVDEISNSDSVIIPTAVDPNNILFFPDPKSFLEFIEIKNSKVGSQNSRVSSDGFISFNNAVVSALDEFSLAEEENEALNILSNNKDIIILRGDTYGPVISGLYGDICNRDRIYQTSNNVNKVLNDEYIVSANKDKLDLLKNVERIDNLDTLIFSVRRISNSTDKTDNGGRTSSICGDNFLVDYFENNSGCKNDRRVWIKARTYFGFFNDNFYFPWTEILEYGELRKFTCGWFPYRTILNSRNVLFTVNSFGLENPNWGWTTPQSALRIPFTATASDYYGTTDMYNRVIFHQPTGAMLFVANTTIPINSQISDPYGFTSIRVEASSRGTNNNWAVLNCN